MKILCLQLARLGDIYQTRPVLNALVRKYPHAEIDLLVRTRFVGAAADLPPSVRVLTLDTKHFLTPIIKNPKGLNEAIEQFSCWISDLKNQDYEEIINLSFSPFSSFLTDLIRGQRSKLSGYTRHSDGYFHIPDDPSSYFFAQVGLGRPNRIHLTDIFALVANVVLTPEDFHIKSERKIESQELKFIGGDNPPYLAFHVGASSKNKTCTGSEWAAIIANVLDVFPGHLAILGTAEEWPRELDELKNNRIIRLCGLTQLSELPFVVSNAVAVVGGDSMVMHLASLTGTPCFNVSYPAVNFWETGPRTSKSRVYRLASSTLSAHHVADEIIKFILGEKTSPQIYEVQSESGVIYGRADGDQQTVWANEKHVESGEFTWLLLKALYMNGDFPQTEKRSVQIGFEKLLEVSLLAIDQMRLLANESKKELASKLIEQSDQIINRVGQITPEVAPLVRWFQTEKIRIPPGDFAEVLKCSEELYLKLGEICSLYSLTQKFEENLHRGELNWKP